MTRRKAPNLDWETGCFEPALDRIAQTLADASMAVMTCQQLASLILSDLADINITVEFAEGPKSTTPDDQPEGAGESDGSE